MTSKADKLPLETEPVSRDDNAIFSLKPGHQTFAVLYAADNGPIYTGDGSSVWDTNFGKER